MDKQLTLPADFNLQPKRGLTTPRKFVVALLQSGAKLYDYGIETWASEYAEPGYDSPKSGILFGNWNDPDGKWQGKSKPERFARIAEYVGYECEWYDEWSTCSDCGKAVRTSPDSYSWRKSYAFVADSDLLCHECIKADPADYVERELLNNATCADTMDLDLGALGFHQWNQDSYENGFHPGQNDNPKTIVKQLPPDVDYVFQIPSVGQFDISFNIWIRAKETE